MRKLIALLTVFCIGASPCAALDPQDCFEIKSKFGITPEECRFGASASELLPSPPKGRPTGATGESHIFFPRGGTQLDSFALAQIQILGRIFRGEVMSPTCIQLIGHSDSSGDRSANEKIALSRAQAVQEALAWQLSSASKIQSVISAGERDHLADLPSRSRWQRRVEIRVRSCEPQQALYR